VVTYARQYCGAQSSPVVAGGLVLVGRECAQLEMLYRRDGVVPQGAVQAFHAADGSSAWTYLTVTGPEDGAMAWSTVTVDVANGTVYATTDNNYTIGGAGSDAFHAIDLYTGERLWRTQVREDDVFSWFSALQGPDGGFGASAMLTAVGKHGSVAAGDKMSAFWSLDARTGEIRWKRDGLSASRDTSTGGNLIGGAFDGQRFFVTFNDRFANRTNLHAMDAGDGTSVWPVKVLPKLAWGGPSLANGLLVVPSGDELHLLLRPAERAEASRVLRPAVIRVDATRHGSRFVACGGGEQLRDGDGEQGRKQW
jgi:outer membrane protein assembly factor BamB